jgi:hypothetical protein
MINRTVSVKEVRRCFINTLLACSRFSRIYNHHPLIQFDKKPYIISYPYRKRELDLSNLFICPTCPSLCARHKFYGNFPSVCVQVLALKWTYFFFKTKGSTEKIRKKSGKWIYGFLLLPPQSHKNVVFDFLQTTFDHSSYLNFLYK